MATQRVVTVVDDLDGSEDARTYTFAWGTTRYEIDLSDEHRDEFLNLLQPYIAAGRRTSATARGASR